MTILQFKGEYEFLSNFYPAEVRGIGGLLYPTVEHAYQAGKSSSPADWEEMAQCKTAGAAKKLGRRLAIRPYWDQIKITVMWQALAQKFSPDIHPEFWARLDATGEAFLQEGNDWGDRFWGVDLQSGMGANVLGQLLMLIRLQTRQSQ